MSTVSVNTIDKNSGSTLTIGSAGTTVNIAGTAGTGFPADTDTVRPNAMPLVINGSMAVAQRATSATGITRS